MDYGDNMRQVKRETEQYSDGSVRSKHVDSHNHDWCSRVEEGSIKRFKESTCYMDSDFLVKLINASELPRATARNVIGDPLLGQDNCNSDSDTKVKPVVEWSLMCGETPTMTAKRL